jgi:hypothetical protein
LQGFPEAPKRGNYKLPERMRTKQEIYNMILDGHTYESIMQYMRISERSFYRYLDIIFAQEKDLLLNESANLEEIRRQQKLCRDGLREDMQRMITISNNPEHKLAVEAQHLASEIRCTILKTYVEPLSALAHSHTFRHNALAGEGSTGVRLRLVKDPVTQLPLRYQIVEREEADSSTEEQEEDYEEEEEEEEQSDGSSSST